MRPDEWILASRRLARAAGAIVLLLALSLPASAGDRCKLVAANIPVTMANSRVVVTAEINGAPARFMVDTGAFYQMMSPAAAARFKLPLQPAPYGLRISGVGGSFAPQVATARTFTLGGVPFHGVPFLVGGNDFGGGVAGLLGQNLFGAFDVELDLPEGIFRLIRPEHCRGAQVAYWARNQAVAEVSLERTSESDPHLIGSAKLDGRSIRVMFDTGAERSLLSLSAARLIGVTPNSPGVKRIGMTFGMGRRPVEVWSAPIVSLQIGSEKIEHTHILIGHLDALQTRADMVIGEDFFLAHHAYIANSQRRIYFTYSGGPVFALNVAHATNTANTANTAASAAASLAAAPSPASPLGGTPTDAAGFMRRGTAYASRAELHRALADLSRACQLAPNDAYDFYQRGLVYWRLKNGPRALADFDTALRISRGDYPVLLSRAELQLPKLHSGVEPDLDAADRLAPPEAEDRLALARLYEAIGEYAGAVHQLDLWIAYHRTDVELPLALNARCWSEAVANVDVHRAVRDCTRALRLDPHTADFHDSRGLAWLRLGRLDKAIADYDAALERSPKLADSLYGRGLAELRLGEKAKGEADLAAATVASPKIAARFSRMGLTPPAH